MNIKERDTFSTALWVDKEEQQLLSHTATRKMTMFPQPYSSFYLYTCFATFSHIYFISLEIVFKISCTLCNIVHNKLIRPNYYLPRIILFFPQYDIVANTDQVTFTVWMNYDVRWYLLFINHLDYVEIKLIAPDSLIIFAWWMF